MRSRHKIKDLQNFVDDIRAKQRNTVWPDPMVNARGMDEFLFKGSRNPATVQPVGAWIVACGFLGPGVVILGMSFKEGSLIGIGFGLACLLIGIKVFRNGFRRSSRDSKSK